MPKFLPTVTQPSDAGGVRSRQGAGLSLKAGTYFDGILNYTFSCLQNPFAWRESRSWVRLLEATSFLFPIAHLLEPDECNQNHVHRNGCRGQEKPTVISRPSLWITRFLHCKNLSVLRNDFVRTHKRFRALTPTSRSDLRGHRASTSSKNMTQGAELLARWNTWRTARSLSPTYWHSKNNRDWSTFGLGPNHSKTSSKWHLHIRVQKALGWPHATADTYPFLMHKNSQYVAQLNKISYYWRL